MLWHPAFAGIASSGDVGFTTGPWIFKRTLSTDSVLASGYYSTIWIRNASGIWKAVADMGIQCDSGAYHDSMLRTWENKAGDSHKKLGIMDIENNFISAYEKHGAIAFEAVTDNNSWFNVNGHRPFKVADSIKTQAVAAIPAGISFVAVKGRMSASGDLGYVYGIVNHNGKADNYMRVWKAGPNGYTLLLQVLGWQ